VTRLGETARGLWRELRRQKLRTALSLGGIAWGTLAILLLLAFSVGFEELFANRARGLGDGIAICWPSRTTRPWQGFPAGRRILPTRDDVLAVGAAVPGVAAISAEFTASERVRVGARFVHVNVSGVEVPFGWLRQLAPMPGGRFLNERDFAERRRVVFVGDRLARSLFGEADPIGRTLVLREQAFTVIGVLRPKEQDSDYYGLDTYRAFAPITTIGEVFGHRTINDFVFRARDPHRQAECTAAVVAALATRLRFDPGDRSALSVWDTTEQQRMLGFIFLGFHSLLGIAGVVTLLAGGVGVANLMFLLVRRRTAEIGLKLAVGARPSQVRREVLTEALVLVGTGGLAGAGLAILAVAIAGAGPWTSEVGVPRIPPLLGIASATLLALIGVLAGWFPARAAARLQPVDALRSGHG
jgi:putative ABC transport system permease protein